MRRDEALEAAIDAIAGNVQRKGVGAVGAGALGGHPLQRDGAGIRTFVVILPGAVIAAAEIRTGEGGRCGGAGGAGMQQRDQRERGEGGRREA